MMHTTNISSTFHPFVPIQYKSFQHPMYSFHYTHYIRLFYEYFNYMRYVKRKKNNATRSILLWWFRYHHHYCYAAAADTSVLHRTFNIISYFATCHFNQYVHLNEYHGFKNAIANAHIVAEEWVEVAKLKAEEFNGKRNRNR